MGEGKSQMISYKHFSAKMMPFLSEEISKRIFSLRTEVGVERYADL